MHALFPFRSSIALGRHAQGLTFECTKQFYAPNFTFVQRATIAATILYSDTGRKRDCISIKGLSTASSTGLERQRIMAFTADSTFDRPRLFSSTTPVHETLPVPCNFITFLAAAQKLGVSFLPITWQPKRPSLGEGGTSQIGQALMNLQTSLAFKRVSDRDKLETPKEEILRRCINEMTILWHPAVRSHPNVLELQGICWDVSPKTQEGAEATPPPSSDDETVWPVLVFEKSHFEDLYHFARLPVGRELGMTDRLKICLQIGEAIAHMQSNSEYP